MLDAVQNSANSHPPSGRGDVVVRPSENRAPPAVVATNQAPVASPQINVDPVVGVIVQFLNSSGSVESQSPSFAAEAYLRAGLTAEGFSKDPPLEHTQVTV